MHAGATAECLDGIQKPLMQSRHASSASSSLRVACILKLAWRLESGPEYRPKLTPPAQRASLNLRAPGERRRTPQSARSWHRNLENAPRHASRTNQPTPLPPAITPSQRRADTDRVPTSAVTLPSDSDDAALDAIAANGRPLALPDAIKQAFRLQPRLRAQLEVIAEARGLQQIAFSTFLPLVAANYDVGEFSLGVTGNSIPIPKGPPGFNFIPGVGAVPFGLNIGTSFELAELKVQWLLLDFGRRLGRYEQSRLATEIAGLQTGRAYQTVANEVAVAYYNVLRSQALRRTAQDALRRSEEELVDARKRQREGVIEREVVLRAEVQHAETLQAVHTATETEFTALAALNLAIGLKCNEPVRVLEPPEAPPIGISLAECLETAVRERREFGVIRSTVEIAFKVRESPGPSSLPRSSRMGSYLTLRSSITTVAWISALASSDSSGCSSRVGGRSPRLRVAEARVGRRWRRPSRLPIRSHSRSMKRIGRPSRPG